MADDDRNTWLDQRAAERLLDGEPPDVGPGLPPADRDTAERLAALLDTAARAARPAPGTELPGEQAALAAFRAARVAESAGPARNGRAANGHGLNGRAPKRAWPGGGARVPVRQAPAEPVVLLGPGATAVRRPPRRLQRLRTAAAVTAAGCVLGGAALAAGTVLRSAPAAPESSRGPAASPTAAESPEPTGGADANEGAASAGGSRAQESTEGRRDAPGTGGATGTQPDGGADAAGEPDARPDGEASPEGPGQAGDRAAKGRSVERLCENYLAARDGGEKKPGAGKSFNRLAREAGGADGIADYCERHGGSGAGHGRGDGHEDDEDGGRAGNEGNEGNEGDGHD